MPQVRLIYFSENQIDPGAGSVVRVLNEILGASNRNNKPEDLTGALVFDDQWFVQTLEGERDKVWRTYDRISDDERHANLVIAELTDIGSRTFGNWWMGLATRNAQTQTAFAPFLSDGRLDPRTMTAAQMLSLMVDLSRIGLSRDLVTRQDDVRESTF